MEKIVRIITNCHLSSFWQNKGVNCRKLIVFAVGVVYISNMFVQGTCCSK